ncbi:MAG: ATP-dependent DNA helicase [Nitrospirae bacterium]|nr:ATP-dependent DNA helicase [Nitrospirota bacterium]
MKELESREGFLYRPEQYNLAMGIYDTIETGGVSIYESPTGTGKTLAYLIAACEFVSKAKGKVTIATPSKALQKQAIEEYNRFIRKYYPGVKIGILKGRNNYLNKEKLAREISLTDNEEEREILDSLLINAETVNGDTDFLGEAILSKLKEKEISLESFLVSPYVESDPESLYYYERAKLFASGAGIVITNHHSWISFAMQKKDAPFSTNNVIVDEAHQLDRNAISITQEGVAYTTVRHILKRLLSILTKEREKGNKGKGGVTTSTLELFEEKIAFISKIIKKISQLAAGDARSTLVLSTTRYNADDHLYIEASRSIKQVQSIIETTFKAVESIKNKKAFGHILPDLYSARESVNKTLKYVKGMFFDKDNCCLFPLLSFSDIERFPSVYIINANAARILSPVFAKCRSLVAVSGTLSDLNGSFRSFRIKTGLNNLIDRIGLIEERQFSGFSFKDSTVFLYPDGASPDFNGEGSNEQKTRQYVWDLKKLVARIISRAEKGTLILCPSHMETRAWVEALEDTVSKPMYSYLPWTGWPLLSIAEEFRKNGGVLVTASGWTGIDIPDVVSDLIITRLPFSSPNNPYEVAVRNYYLTKNLKGIYYTLYQYETFLLVKQGIGRAIRKETDTANIHILDPRVREKKYSYYLDYFERKYRVKFKETTARPRIESVESQSEIITFV